MYLHFMFLVSLARLAFWRFKTMFMFSQAVNEETAP